MQRGCVISSVLIARATGAHRSAAARRLPLINECGKCRNACLILVYACKEKSGPRACWPGLTRSLPLSLPAESLSPKGGEVQAAWPLPPPPPSNVSGLWANPDFGGEEFFSVFSRHASVNKHWTHRNSSSDGESGLHSRLLISSAYSKDSQSLVSKSNAPQVKSISFQSVNVGRGVGPDILT